MQSVFLQLRRIFGKEIKQFSLAAFLQQTARFAGTMKINPVLPQSLQARESGHTAINRNPRRFIARQAAFQNEHPVVTRGQIKRRQGRIKLSAIGKK